MPSSAAARRLLRREVIGPAVFLSVTAAMVVTLGVPGQRDVLALWLLLGLLAFSLTDVRDWARGLIRDWLPFFGLLVAYDALRGLSAGL
ncbi:MAG: inositol phosphorylceramide synthase, partial [Actinomycetota bacterium]|nr:inositol phosphorylceramide synthase [Actinomycetota bacterium]